MMSYRGKLTGEDLSRCLNKIESLGLRQEAQLPQIDRATRYISEFMLCFTSYGSYKQQK